MSERVFSVEYCTRRSRETRDLVIAGRLDYAEHIPLEAVEATVPPAPEVGERGFTAFKTDLSLDEVYALVGEIYGEVDVAGAFIDLHETEAAAT